MRMNKTESGAGWECPLLVLWLVLCAQTCLGFYSPSQGRWLSRDPIGEPGGKNLCGFVGNDPIQDIDVRGLSPGKCQNCCCCAENIRVTSEGFQNIIYFGHTIKVELTLNYKISSKSGDCTLKWFERTDQPYTTDMRITGPNVWQDMTKDSETKGSFAWWTKKAKPCPGLLPLQDEDPARYNRRAKASRTLEFFVIVESTPGCPCKKPYVGFIAKQVLDPTAAPPVQDFTLISTF
jgi:hypothetical protein